MRKSRKETKKAIISIEPAEKAKPNLVYASAKTHLLYYSSLDEKVKNIVKKRLPKYIDKLVYEEDSSLTSRLKRVKKMSSLNFVPPKHHYSRLFTRSSKLIKILKSFRKYLKQVDKGISFEPSLLVHCPYLQELKLSQSQSSSWKILRSFPKIESLILNLNLYAAAQFNQHLRGFLYRVIKRSASQGCLKHLQIIFTQHSDVILEMVMRELLMCRTLLSSLKTFAVFTSKNQINFSPEICTYITKVSVNSNVQMIYPAHSIFHIENGCSSKPEIFNHIQSCSSPLSSFERIQDLEVVVTGNSVLELSSVIALNQLKRLKLDINIEYKKEMDNFLSHFSIPRDIEAVTLRMASVNLKNIARSPISTSKKFSQFIGQWAEKNRLKYLSLYAKDETRGAQFISDITIPILNELSVLRTLKTTNFHSGSTGRSYCRGSSYYYVSAPDENPLRFGTLCKGIQTVEESIQKLCVRDVKITYDGFEYVIELFKKKQELNLPFTAEIDGLEIINSDQLQLFLSQLVQIPPGRYFYVNVVVENLSPDGLKALLCSFLTGSSKITAKIDLCLTNLSKKMTATDEKHMRRTALANKKFQSLKITTKRGAEVLNV